MTNLVITILPPLVVVALDLEDDIRFGDYKDRRDDDIGVAIVDHSTFLELMIVDGRGKHRRECRRKGSRKKSEPHDLSVREMEGYPPPVGGLFIFFCAIRSYDQIIILLLFLEQADMRLTTRGLVCRRGWRKLGGGNATHWRRRRSWITNLSVWNARVLR